MNPETRICQNCKQNFVIEPEDFLFYEKIKVPPPTFCPDCRRQRRLGFVNFFNLYKRLCGLCKKEVISMYPPEIPYIVYCPSCWYSDSWDPYSYGRDYDFSRPFFEQFKELWQSVPLLGLSVNLQTSKNSPYNNNCNSLKNCYLMFYSDYDEHCQYCFYLFNSKNCFNSAAAGFCELCFDMRNGWKNNRCVGTINTTDSLDSCFLRDSINCKDCFASANLRNAQYQIFNKQLTKEEYTKEMKKWDLGSYSVYQEAKRRAQEHWRLFPPWPIKDSWSENISGNYVFQSRNCQHCFEVIGAENSKYLFMVPEGPITETYDISGWGEGMELSYECASAGLNASRVKFCNYSEDKISECEYCVYVNSSSNMLASISIRRGGYTIFNKKYTKEEFFKLREKIMQHMNEAPYIDHLGNIYKYGEFFPLEISPHAYNESIANDFFSIPGDELEKRGYRYQEPYTAEHSVTLQYADIPDHIKDAQDSILNEVIACQICSKGFRISMQELEFLRNMKLPLPRECPFCRIKEKFLEWTKEFQLGDRTCNKCGILFQTPYKTEKNPVVWCKSCYKEEVI